MQTSPTAAQVSVPGFADHHAHLLRDAAGVAFPATAQAVRDFHRRVAEQGLSPMDVLDPPAQVARPALDSRLAAALTGAAAVGLVEVTEMGMRSWAYLDALTALQAAGPMPCRVRIYLASGLAGECSPAELEARRAEGGPWVQLDGVKFYADGWLGPRTCAMWRKFDDEDSDGILFQIATPNDADVSLGGVFSVDAVR